MDEQSTHTLALAARESVYELGATPCEARNAVLAAVKQYLASHESDILEANAMDCAAAEKLGVSNALQKRLDLRIPGKWQSLLKGLDEVIALDDPIGHTTLKMELADGLILRRVTCPIGVICIIFESRPEAVVQIASLAIKSGNAVILKGGKEASRSNAALVDAFRTAIQEHHECMVSFGNTGNHVPADAIQLVSTREEISELLKEDRLIDLIIPRGSNELVRYIQSNTRIPVIGHADGICSIFVDRGATSMEYKDVMKIIIDSKTQYPAACNSAETLLFHEGATDLLPEVARALHGAGVALVVDERAKKIITDVPSELAIDQDYKTEFLDLRIAVKVVDSLNEAINHINANGSHHTDCIITSDKVNADVFMTQVDSANVFHNASTRFADGFRYGFGAEIGISTNKLHARGPVGLEGLMSYKYRLTSEPRDDETQSYNAHIVADFISGSREFTHRVK